MLEQLLDDVREIERKEDAREDPFAKAQKRVDHVRDPVANREDAVPELVEELRKPILNVSNVDEAKLVDRAHDEAPPRDLLNDVLEDDKREDDRQKNQPQVELLSRVLAQSIWFVRSPTAEPDAAQVGLMRRVGPSDGRTALELKRVPFFSRIAENVQIAFYDSPQIAESVPVAFDVLKPCTGR